MVMRERERSIRRRSFPFEEPSGNANSNESREIMESSLSFSSVRRASRMSHVLPSKGLWDWKITNIARNYTE